MAIERARVQAVGKPWGSEDLRPWSKASLKGAMIGELWFQRTELDSPEPKLLLKLLFTKERLSIQVHPDDRLAKTLGLDRGKTEAWYILEAVAGAQVAVGLKQPLTARELRTSIEDGSIADLIQWREVISGDAVFVPAGTIHAIGSGLVLAEIQQRSDTTFRLFDYGRQRALHVGSAVAASNLGVLDSLPPPQRLSQARTVLVSSSYFVLERIDLPPNTNWDLVAELETWLLVIGGSARVDRMNTTTGDAIFLEEDQATIKVGPDGLRGLLAYSSPVPLIHALTEPEEISGDINSRRDWRQLPFQVAAGDSQRAEHRQ